MVADLLELHQRCEHDAGSPRSRSTSSAPLQHLVDDRLVQRRLLAGQVAVDSHLDLLRQIADDLLVGLQPPEHERAGRPAQARRRGAVAPALDRRRELLAEARSSSRAGPGSGTRRSSADSPSRFSTGVPVSATRWRARSARIARVCLASRVLMFCASSSTIRCHSPASKRLAVAERERVRRHDQVAARARRARTPSR